MNGGGKRDRREEEDEDEALVIIIFYFHVNTRVCMYVCMLCLWRVLSGGAVVQCCSMFEPGRCSGRLVWRLEKRSLFS